MSRGPNRARVSDVVSEVLHGSFESQCLRLCRRLLSDEKTDVLDRRGVLLSEVLERAELPSAYRRVGAHGVWQVERAL